MGQVEAHVADGTEGLGGVTGAEAAGVFAKVSVEDMHDPPLVHRAINHNSSGDGPVRNFQAHPPDSRMNRNSLAHFWSNSGQSVTCDQ